MFPLKLKIYKPEHCRSLLNQLFILAGGTQERKSNLTKIRTFFDQTVSQVTKLAQYVIMATFTPNTSSQ